MKTCSKCKIDKELSEFIHRKCNNDGLDNRCNNCRSEYAKQYRLNNKEKIEATRVKGKLKRTEWRKEYEQKNKVKLNKYKNEYLKNKRKNDELFKLKHTLRNTLLNSFKKNRISKNLKAEELLGCSFEEFKDYIESKFTDGMTWENRGLYGWHLDHIFPISLAKDEAHLIELNHYTNFQPLWAIDNLKKGNKIADKIYLIKN